MDVHCFTHNYDKKVTEIYTDVGVRWAFGDCKKFTEYKAVWDTGATITSISEKIVGELGLQPVGVKKVHYVNGTDYVPNYYVDIALPNKFIVPELIVVSGRCQEDDVLIGMDIINLGSFAISNFNNKTTFSFMIPSTDKIDFQT